MKARIYVRVAKGRNGNKVAATVRPSYYPLTETRDGQELALPTAMFALELDVPEEALRRAEQVAATVTLDPDAAQVIVEPPSDPPIGAAA